MEILLWLLPAAVTTGLAMVWASWAGRERPDRERTEADQERLGAALNRPMPSASVRRSGPADRSTGVVTRPAAPAPETRRSA